MQFALAAALAASLLAVAAPTLAPHHTGLAERSRAAALWSQADLAAEPREPSADSAPGPDLPPGE